MAGATSTSGQPIKRITLLQGQVRVSAVPQVEISTLLGSCIATCLFDPELGLGGMNHFLLAAPLAGTATHLASQHYGAYLMKLLIDEMLAHGASKPRLRAHLYGGANVHPGMIEFGTVNAEFACAYLARERIPVVRKNLGGVNARRVDFRPALGKARCRVVDNSLVSQSSIDPGADCGKLYPPTDAMKAMAIR